MRGCPAVRAELYEWVFDISGPALEPEPTPGPGSRLAPAVTGCPDRAVADNGIVAGRGTRGHVAPSPGDPGEHRPSLGAVEAGAGEDDEVQGHDDHSGSGHDGHVLDATVSCDEVPQGPA
jgi:hypothetical protein